MITDAPYRRSDYADYFVDVGDELPPIALETAVQVDDPGYLLAEPTVSIAVLDLGGGCAGASS